MNASIRSWGVRLFLLAGIGLLACPPALASTVTDVFLYGTAAADGNHPNGRIMTIDYTTSTVTATFNGPSDVVIGDGFTGTAFRSATGELYIVDGLGTNNIYRINSANGVVNSFFPSPTGASTIDGLEFVGDTLYGTVFGSGGLVKIDPDSGSLLDSLPFGPGSSSVLEGLGVVNGILYSRGDANTTIAARSPVDGAILFSFATPDSAAVAGLAGFGGDLYAAADTGRIYRLNPLTGDVLDFIDIGITLDSLAAPTVPEPSTLALIGLASLALFRRR